MADSGDVIEVSGFDPEGEPEIRVEDGRLLLAFNFMPPSWMPDARDADLGACEDFDKQMQKAIGVSVSWEDREFFLIEAPRADTVERIRKFLVEFRRLHGSA